MYEQPSKCLMAYTTIMELDTGIRKPILDLYQNVTILHDLYTKLHNDLNKLYQLISPLLSY